jgi:hypothetical protein
MHAEVLQVVLAGATIWMFSAAGPCAASASSFCLYSGLASCAACAAAQGRLVVAQRRPVCELGCATSCGVPWPPPARRVAAFGAQVDQPVAGAHHVEVVLDHDQRVAGVQQLAQRAHQLGDVVEVQAGGRLVEQEQLALARRGLAAGGCCGRPRPGARQLQALRLAADSVGTGWPSRT